MSLQPGVTRPFARFPPSAEAVTFLFESFLVLHLWRLKCNTPCGHLGFVSSTVIKP